MLKISIIIPVYNVEKYIRRCINSVFSQTYSGEMECIIVDDCSPDKSISIIKEMLENYQGSIEIKMVQHRENRGLSAARNTGVTHATGEYLFFMDSDDEITPDCIEILVAKAMEYLKVDIVQGNCGIKEGTHNWGSTPLSLPSYSDDRKWIRDMLYSCESFPSTAWNKLIRRFFFLQHQLWFKEGIIYEDYLWHVWAAKRIESIAFCFIPTYFYYINPTSLTGEKNYERNYLSWLIVIEEGVKSMVWGYNYKEFRNRWVSTAQRLLDAERRVKDPKKFHKKYQEMVSRINKLPLSWQVRLPFYLYYTPFLTRWVYRIYVNIQKLKKN